MVPIKTVSSGDYTTLVFSFIDLELFLARLRPHIQYTPMYTYFPTNVSELILNRTPTKTAAVGQLCLLPISKELRISNSYKQDITTLAAV